LLIIAVAFTFIAALWTDPYWHHTPCSEADRQAAMRKEEASCLKLQ
jgi:hypothetical protein